MNAKNSEQYLRTPAAAEYLSISKSTLDKLRLTGGGPAYSSLGRVIVYRLGDLDDWVTSHKRLSTSNMTIRRQNS